MVGTGTRFGIEQADDGLRPRQIAGAEQHEHALRRRVRRPSFCRTWRRHPSRRWYASPTPARSRPASACPRSTSRRELFHPHREAFEVDGPKLVVRATSAASLGRRSHRPSPVTPPTHSRLGARPSCMVHAARRARAARWVGLRVSFPGYVMFRHWAASPVQVDPLVQMAEAGATGRPSQPEPPEASEMLRAYKSKALHRLESIGPCRRCGSKTPRAATRTPERSGARRHSF